MPVGRIQYPEGLISDLEEKSGSAVVGSQIGPASAACRISDDDPPQGRLSAPRPIVRPLPLDLGRGLA